MSYRKHLLPLGLVVGVLSFGILAHHVLSPTPGVSLRNFRLLRAGWDTGMTENEVDGLFGEPGVPAFRVTGSYFRKWTTGAISVELRFSSVDRRLESGYYTNHVTGFVENLPVPPWEPQEPLLEKIRRWLGM